jgi:multiple sugar transport system substrate-binding protein
VKKISDRFPKLDQQRCDTFLLYLGLTILAAALLLVLIQNPKSALLILPDSEKNLAFTQWWEDEMDEGVLLSLIREYEEQHQGIRITLNTKSWESVRDTLFNAEETDMGDLLGIDPRWLSELIKNDTLEPLGAYSQDNPVNPADPENLPWVVPLESFMTLLYYNTDILQEAGFDRPPRDQREFEAYARSTSDKGKGRFGYALSLSPEDSNSIYRDIYPWIWASGKTMIDDDELHFDTPPVIELLGYLNNLYKEGYIAPDIFAKTGKERIADFLSGRTAMMSGDIRNIRIIEKAGVSFGITAIPAPASYVGKPILAAAAWYGGILKTSQYKDEAWEFLMFLAEKAPAIAVAAGTLPPSIETQAPMDGDSWYSKAYDINNAGEVREELIGFPGEIPLERILREELPPMFAGTQSPADTARAVQQRWQQQH